MEKRIGLFGGTFNPVHKGHVLAARQFARAADLSEMYVMPAKLPPHKVTDGADSVSNRFNMAYLALRDVGCPVKISAVELMRDGASYSIDTVNTILEKTGAEKIYMYIGSDMLFYFTKWKSFEELFKKCVLVTTARSEKDRVSILSVCEEYKRDYGCEYILMDYAPLEISSTEIRELFAKNDSFSAKNYLTEDVYRYIIKGGLFTEAKTESAQSLCERIKKDLQGLVDSKRYSHILSVEKEALNIAHVLDGVYTDISLDDISLAALLHDITKCKDAAWQKEYLSQFETVRENSDAVLHSWTSAYYALINYGISREVFLAIYNHTTGRANMSILEKIIYLADFIEPEREHTACRELRECFYSAVSAAKTREELKAALDRTLIKSFEMTRAHLLELGKPISEELYLALDFLKKQISN